MKMLSTTLTTLFRHHSPCQQAGSFVITSALPGRAGLLLLALTALGTAHAQIFVSNYSGNSIGKYDAYTGAAINASLVTSGVSQPLGIAVSDSALYVALHESGTVNSYSLAGATISVPFLTMTPWQTYQPVGLMLSGSTLYVGGGTLGTYNTTNGQAINASLVSPTWAVGLALSGSGSTLYISNSAAGTIGTYNASDGQAINASFIAGLPTNSGSVNDIALFGSTLFVADRGNGKISTYDAITGGTAINPTFITGLNQPYGLAVTGSTLFVSEFGGNKIGAYDAATGAVINASFITGLNGPTYFAVLGGAIPEPSTYAALAGLAALGFAAYRRRRKSV